MNVKVCLLVVNKHEYAQSGFDAYAQCGPCVERYGTLVTPSSSSGLCPSQSSSHSRQASVTRPDFTVGALGPSIPVASLKPTSSSRYPGQSPPLSVSRNRNYSSLSKEVEDVACRRRRWRPTGVGARILVGFLSDVKIPVIRICNLFSKASNYFAGSSFFRTGTSLMSRESVDCGIEGGRAPCVLLRASRTLRRA
jgi:hypothetical protein